MNDENNPFGPLGELARTLHQRALLEQLGRDVKPVPSHPPEADFQRWMTEQRIDPRELDVYDFRSAMMAGAQRDASGHWPSEFKRQNHPNLVVGGFNTKTGERVPGTPMAKSVQELIDLGWDPGTAYAMWNREMGQK